MGLIIHDIMTSIGSICEDKTKNLLGFEDKPLWETGRKLFQNLIGICLVHNIPVLMDGKRINRVKVHLFDSNLKNDYGMQEAKPIVKDNRLYLSIRYNPNKIKLIQGEVLNDDGTIFCTFPRKGEVLIDAALAFGEEVQAL
jgi:hypothetical protein